MADLVGYRNWAVTSNGTIVPSAAVEVRIKSTAALAVLHEDAGAVTPLVNPFTAEADGSFEFFTVPDLYDLIVGTGLSQETVPLNLMPENSDLSFTPTLADAASGGNEATAGTASGRYAQNGRLILMKLRFVNIDTTGLTGGNDIFLTGLPFISATSNPRTFGSVKTDNVALAGTLISEIQSEDSFIKIWDNQNAAAGAYLTVAALTSGIADIDLSIVYEVDA